MREPGERSGHGPAAQSDEETDLIMRWLRLAADVVERGGGRKGGERVHEDEEDPRGKSAT